MFDFLKQTPEKQVFSKVWPSSDALVVFNRNPTYPVSALNGSLAIANFALASVLLNLNTNSISNGVLRAVENMIFEKLEADQNYYEARTVLLLETEQKIWFRETNSNPETRSRIHTILCTAFISRVFEYQTDCRKDLVEMQKMPGHMGLEFFTKRALSHLVGQPVLQPADPLEAGLDDAISLAYFNLVMTNLLK